MRTGLKILQKLIFQPTLPVREVTFLLRRLIAIIDISTHTSREGSDYINT